MTITPLIPEALTVLAAAALAVGAVALVAGVLAMRRAGRLEAHYRALMTGVDGADMAAALQAQGARLDAAEGRLDGLEGGARDLDARLRRALQRVRVLRYNPFDDAGGDQSFVVVLLDDEADGILLSGLHNRQGVRVYAKPVLGGRSSYGLTTEEERVLGEATAGAGDG